MVERGGTRKETGYSHTSLHLLAWEKKAWHPPLAVRFWLHFPPGHCLLLRPHGPLPSPCRPGTAVLEAPTHHCTSSPPYSISPLWLPPSAWELTEEIPGSCKHSPRAAPCHFQFPKVLFSERQSPSIPHTLTFSSLHPQAVLSPFPPPWLYEWQSSRVSCQVFFCASIALPQGDLPSLGVSVLPCCTGQFQQSCKPAAAEERGTPSLKSGFRQGGPLCSRSHTQFGRCSVGSCGSPVMGSCLCKGCPLPCCRGGSQDAFGQEQLSGGPWDCSTDQPPAVSKLLVAPSPKPALPVLQAGRYL